MAKTTILAVLATSFLAAGCRPNKGTASPQDYFPLIQVALQGGEVAAMIGRNEAIKAKSFGGCVASDVMSGAFDSAGSALNGKLTGDVVIPGFDLDLSECLALRPAAEAGAENASYPTVVVATIVCGYGPAEEAPATEDPTKPAEDAAAEEKPAEDSTKPAEEAPAEEAPADPEPVAEESDPAETTKGNEDAARLVEGIAGVAIIAGTHYANKLKATDCKKGTVALAALGYLSGMIKPIADEIASPDGKVSVPAVPVDMSACSEG